MKTICRLGLFKAPDPKKYKAIFKENNFKNQQAVVPYQYVHFHGDEPFNAQFTITKEEAFSLEMFQTLFTVKLN